MDKIIEQIKSNRPSLSPSSLKTYSSTLKNIYFKIFGSTNDINYSFFNKTEPIIQYLSTKNPSSRKSALSALFVFTELPIYREAMNKDINEYNNQVATQEKNDKQKDYWLSKEELQNVYERVKKEALRLFRNKTYTMDDLQKIQDYVILSLYILTQPRRALDYTHLILNKDNHSNIYNYIDKNHFIFNTYKTSKYYGQQIEAIPPKLLSILKKWIKINPTNSLLFNSKGEKLTSVSLNQKLNKIFGKRISVNALRHLYISHNYGDLIDNVR